jgi:hypothetical protein
MAVREVDEVVSSDKDTLTLSAPGWDTAGKALHRLYLCWMTGELKGTCHRSIGGSGRTFAIDATSEQIKLIKIGDVVLVGAPFLSNAVVGNAIEINPEHPMASGILFWGFSYRNAICANSVTSPKGNQELSGIGIMSLNGLDSRGSITRPSGGRKAPSENNLVAYNKVTNLNLRVGYQEWGRQIHFESKGNVLIGNSVNGGVVEDAGQRAESPAKQILGGSWPDHSFTESVEDLVIPLRTVGATGSVNFCKTTFAGEGPN